MNLILIDRLIEEIRLEAFSNIKLLTKLKKELRKQEKSGEQDE